LSFVLSKNFVAISAVISPRKFCKVAVIEKVSKRSVRKSASALRENALSEVARLHRCV
jgi:hypothetical protein